MHQIEISKEFGEKVPHIVLSCIQCEVEIREKDVNLWEKITSKIEELGSMKVEEISKIDSIAASRKAYKACGKDPARYRLSAEALLRRILKRGEIYQINNVVDLLNLVSINSGFSIGGYDAGKISGAIKLGVGSKSEYYEGIGRGELNIESMPVFRDEQGAFGTPTSDSQRTAVSLSTQTFLMVILDYNGTEKLSSATNQALELLIKYGGAKNIETKQIRYNEGIQ